MFTVNKQMQFTFLFTIGSQTFNFSMLADTQEDAAKDLRAKLGQICSELDSYKAPSKAN